MSRPIRSLLLASTIACLTIPAFGAVQPRADETSASDDGIRQRNPEVVVIPSGAMLAWEDPRRGIVVRWFDRVGDPAGGTTVLAEADAIPPVPFNRVILREQHNPSLATRGDDTFLLTYTEQRFERTADIFIDQKQLLTSRVMSRLYRADGTPRARPVQLADGATMASRSAVIAANPGFWAAWQQDQGETGIYLQRLNPRGQPIDDKQRISTAGDRVALAAAAGRVLVTWEQDSNLMARVFDDTDGSMSDAFVVAPGQPRPAAAASVAAQPNGDFVVVFQRSLASHALHTRIWAQRVSREGELVGAAKILNADTGDAFSGPRVVSLPGGKWMTSWLTWIGNFRVAVEYGVFGTGLDALERGVLNQRAIGAQVETGLAARDNRIVAAWEGYNERKARALRTRVFADEPGAPQP